MNIIELRTALGRVVPEYLIDKNVHNVSHWVSKIFYAPEQVYSTTDPKDMKMLMKLSELEIVALTEGGTCNARLTKSGEELFKDFEKKGFYGSETVKRFFDIVKKNNQPRS